MNTKLKSTLPKEYSNLNTKFSNLTNVANSLNKALGETVEGVSTRGAGLVKQFFSPSGRKAKEIFDYIQKETGIDLAKDATLARFTMELFDDARAAHLLEGIPTSAKGIVQKILDATIEKTGVGRKLKNSLTESTINKAKDIAQ